MGAEVGEILELEAGRPGAVLELGQHALLAGVLAEVDGDGVVVAVDAVDEALDGRLVQVAGVGRRLAGLVSEHDRFGVDQPKGVDDDLDHLEN